MVCPREERLRPGGGERHEAPAVPGFPWRQQWARWQEREAGHQVRRDLQRENSTGAMGQGRILRHCAGRISSLVGVGR